MSECFKCNSHHFPCVNGICEGCIKSATIICIVCKKRRYRRDIQQYPSQDSQVGCCRFCINHFKKGSKQCPFHKYTYDGPNSHTIFQCKRWLKKGETCCTKHQSIPLNTTFVYIKKKKGMFIQYFAYIQKENAS